VATFCSSCFWGTPKNGQHLSVDPNAVRKIHFWPREVAHDLRHMNQPKLLQANKVAPNLVPMLLAAETPEGRSSLDSTVPIEPNAVTEHEEVTGRQA
jgi:hypothetical protein